MFDQQEQVEKFMGLAGQVIPGTPTARSVVEGGFRAQLIQEELDEYVKAVEDKDLVEIADGIADMLYVVIGTAVAHGIPIAPIFEMVHLSNMAKFGEGGVRMPSGKWQKPCNWEEKHGKPLKTFIRDFLSMRGAPISETHKGQ